MKDSASGSLPISYNLGPKGRGSRRSIVACDSL